ncbi:MAG: thiamine pyrophosphate-dependent dehydrogenase E1 component subunit alpha [Solirubrobacterales bacterium]
MTLIRAVELEIERLFRLGEMSGSFHSSLGQEACAAGVCSVLRPNDLATSTHRGHHHALAKGVPPEALFAELYGNSGGASGGRGGSMHLHHRPSGFLGTNAIVGGGLPWAAGAAWARRRRGGDDISVAFAGDGAFAQGVFHEVLRLSQLWNAPCLFVCENNGLAHSMSSETLFGKPGTIADMVAATGMRAAFVDGRDVMAVRRVADELAGHVRNGRPAFLECLVFRVRAHSLSDAEYRYRRKGAGEAWLEANDPIMRLRERLEPAFADQAAEIELEVQEAVGAARDAAAAQPQPEPRAAFAHVYATTGLDGAT